MCKLFESKNLSFHYPKQDNRQFSHGHYIAPFSGRFWNFQRFEKVFLDRGMIRVSFAHSLVDEIRRRRLSASFSSTVSGTGGQPGGFQTHPHHPMEGQGKKAGQRVGANALRKPVEYRGDLAFGTRKPRSMSTSRSYRAITSAGGEIGDVGHCGQITVEQVGLPERPSSTVNRRFRGISSKEIQARLAVARIRILISLENCGHKQANVFS